MFRWDKSIKALHVPANRVVSLFRSMREVQLALPGVPAQQASAFLCQYQAEGGIGTVAVFHLHKAPALAFYCSDPQVVAAQKADRMLDLGLNFVESMGFLLTNQDMHLLAAADQEMLWASLPLQTGLVEPSTAVPAAEANQRPAAKPVSKAPAAAAQLTRRVEEPVSATGERSKVKTVAAELTTAQTTVAPATAESVDDLLAAVEAMRAKRSGLRVPRQPPSAEEIGCRRQQLRETVGRILAAL